MRSLNDRLIILGFALLIFALVLAVSDARGVLHYVIGTFGLVIVFAGCFGKEVDGDNDNDNDKPSSE